MNLIYRQATSADYDFCRKLHHQGMKPLIEQLWGWKENFQNDRFKRLWTPGNIQVFSTHEKEVGYLEILELEDERRLKNFFVNKSYRGKGIGTKVLLDLISNSKTKCSKISLNVLANNPAYTLYERVGFKLVEAKDDFREYNFNF